MSKKKTQLYQSFLISIIQIQKSNLSLKKLIEMKIMTEDKATCQKEYLLQEQDQHWRESKMKLQNGDEVYECIAELKKKADKL